MRLSDLTNFCFKRFFKQFYILKSKFHWFYSSVGRDFGLGQPWSACAGRELDLFLFDEVSCGTLLEVPGCGSLETSGTFISRSKNI